MIKKPKEINNILTTLTNNGFDAYCGGPCVMRALIGEDPDDWDIYTDCRQEKLKEIFPKADAVNGRILRIETDEKFIDIVSLKDSIENQLKLYTFTVEALAEHPQKPLVNPYGGMEDVEKKLLKTVGNAMEVLKSKPIEIMKIFEYVAVYDFDLSKELSRAITSNAEYLKNPEKTNQADILQYFRIIVNGEYAGKAMKMIGDLNILPAIVGDEGITMGRREVNDYSELAENIHKLQHVELRRMAMFYLCFDRRYETAVSHLPHEEYELELLLESKKQIRNLYFVKNDVELKRFIHRCGWEKYIFFDKLLKAQIIVYDYHKMKAEGRDYILGEIRQKKDPIFEEDLVIDAEDIIEAGITQSVERAQYLLSLLPDVVHQYPKYNERKKLLKYASKFNRSKFSVAFRTVRWLR